MKFGGLIEYNMKYFSWKNHTQNSVEKLVWDPFIKNQNWRYPWINNLKCCKVCLLYVQVKVCQNILKLRCWPLSFTLSKAFLKNKNKSGTSLPTLFSAWFLSKNISHAISYWLTKSNCLIAFTSEDIG